MYQTKPGVVALLWALVALVLIAGGMLAGAGYWIQTNFGANAVLIAAGLVIFVAGGLYGSLMHRSALRMGLQFSAEVLGFAGDYTKVNVEQAKAIRDQMRADAQARVIDVKAADRTAREIGRAYQKALTSGRAPDAPADDWAAAWPAEEGATAAQPGQAGRKWANAQPRQGGSSGVRYYD